MANQVAYGFIDKQHLFDQRVIDVDVQVINDAITASVNEHNRQITAMVALFVERTTEYSRRYKSAGVRRLQPADEFSRPLPTRQPGFYDLAFPLQKGQDALGWTYEASVKMTVRDLNDEIAAMLQADARWMRDHLLGALFDNSNWTFEDEQYGDLTIKPLANGDTDTYLILSGADSGATDNHYLAQTATVADATNPYDEIRDDLMEHPENGGEPVALIPTNLVAPTRGLATFTRAVDPNIRPGANEDVLVGDLGVATPGEVIGYVDETWIVHWRSLPSNYIIATTTQATPALAMREHPEPQLQGFGVDDDNNNYPWYQRNWSRRAGFGANNRVGAVVYQVSGSDTTYDTPSNYSTPMP